MKLAIASLRLAPAACLLLLCSTPSLVAASSFRGSVTAEPDGALPGSSSTSIHRKLPPGCANEGQKSASCGAIGGGTRATCCGDLGCDAGLCVVVSGPSPTPPITPSPTPAGTPSGCPAGLLCACDHDAAASCATDAECDRTVSAMKCTKDPFQGCANDGECAGNGNKCRATTTSVAGKCVVAGTAGPTGSPTKGPTDAPSPSPSNSPTGQPTTANPAATLPPTGAPTTGNPTPGFATFPVASASDISTAMQTAQPGDKLLMSTASPWTNEEIDFRGFGTVGNPITLTSDTPGVPVVLNGASRLRISGSYLVVDGLRFDSGSLLSSAQQVIEFRTSSSNLADHCRLTNTAIVNYNPSDSAFDTRWVGIYGTNNRVDHCYFSGKTNQGPLMVVWRPEGSVNTPDFHRIENNYFGDFASGGGTNGWETIRIGTSATSLSDSSTIVSNNLFQRCNGEIEIISVKSGNNLLSGNTFDSCEGMLTLRHGRGNTVDGNFFFGRDTPNSGGVRIIDSDHVVANNYFEGLLGSSSRAAIVLANGLENSALNQYFPVERATVAFNTIYDCKEAFRIGWRSNDNGVSVSNSTIANNAVYSTSLVASTIINEEDAPTNMLYEGNYMYGAGVNLGLSPAPAGITEVDPGLTNNFSDGLYRPDQATSPCIDNAVGIYSSVLTDMDGQSRSDPKDVGADEVSNDAVISGPLGASDIGGAIGPSWM